MKRIIENRGITLIGLVVTIIILLIISGISLSMLLGENGIIEKAQEAANKNYLESTKEDIKLQISEEIGSNNGLAPSNSVLRSILEKYGTVIYENDGITVKGVITSDKEYQILLSDLGTVKISSTENNNINISYEVKSINGSIYNILVKIISDNGIEKIVYKNASGDDVILLSENDLEVDIDYQAMPNTEYYFVIKQVGNVEQIEKIFVEKIDTILADGSWNGTVNTPKLVSGMTGIYWDDSRNEVQVTADNQGNWYDYTNKKWANAKTLDGSYWVWIPRYEYKITSPHTSTAQTINVNFVEGINTQVTSGYIMHSGFTFGSTELTGIWMAKFEASGNTSAVDVKPNVSSLRNITIDASFTACRNMEINPRYGWDSSGSGIDTHLMKNVEWGAAAYLSSSQYGKNVEVWKNPNSNHITGQAGTTASASYTTSTYAYNDTTYGVNASTTGNIFGIYDMSGGSYEYTAAYVNNGNINLTTYGASLANADVKYKDVYERGTSDSQALNYAANSSKKGDTVYETSSSYTGSTSWFTDQSFMVYSTRLFFIRGGYYNAPGSTDSGMFAFYGYYGSGDLSYIGFRPVFAVADVL